MNFLINLMFIILYKVGFFVVVEIDILMIFVFIGVVVGVMVIFFVGFLNVKRKEVSEMKMVRILFKMLLFFVEFEVFLILVLFKK